MTMKEIGVVLSSLVLLLLTTSCKSLFKGGSGSQRTEIELKIYDEGVPYSFNDLEETIGLNISSSVSNDEIYEDSRVKAINPNYKYPYFFVPSVRSFVDDATRDYMQQMQFRLSQRSDNMLMIEVKNFNIIQKDNQTADCQVSLNYKVINGAGETIIPTRRVSSHDVIRKGDDFGYALGYVYALALNEIRWDAIAKLLRVAPTPREEKNKQVKGDGDTALEHTVIRWFITSAPQGADVTWRVISSTPDVKNTNSTYVGTTPYETTESFDIKGMTYNNSGNIQIEVTCEKDGYLTQKKRFNLRQAIDQKEISAKFNLIKDE